VNGPGDAVPRRGTLHRFRALPHGGSLPENEWQVRHRVVVSLLWAMIAAVGAYALLARGTGALRYAAEFVSMVAFAIIAGWGGTTHKWRALAASMGLLTGCATLVDVSGGMIEMHFSFFVVVVVLTLYEDWVPFLVAVAFVLIHHGVMGTIDPRAVFGDPREWRHPWLYAGLHALFVALAGVAGVTAWGFNERVRLRMRAAQLELERISFTDPLTELGNRRSLMAELTATIAMGTDHLLAIFDLDGFKEYNDRFGHPAGDALLKRLAGRLQVTLGPRARGFRLGGDEFCVLAAISEGQEVGALVSEWTRCFGEHGEGFAISASSGVVRIPAETREVSTALGICDRRMYVDKHGRRPTAARQSRDVLLAALTERHSDLGDHVSGVAAAAARVGAELGLPPRVLQEIAYAADLHDIGKVAIPDSILTKPGPLDSTELEFMRRHTAIGERILAAAPSLGPVATIVRSTHEHFDGGGYPDALAGDQIPLAARVISVCDAYDAMVGPRPYREPATHVEAMAELTRCAGAQFDPDVVAAFTQLFAQAPTEAVAEDRDLAASLVLAAPTG